MKRILSIILFASATLMLNAHKPVANTGKADQTVCTAIRNYLLGEKGAAILTKTAKQDLIESSWPEVQCSVEGTLDPPTAFKNLRVKKVSKGRYKYECTCPVHGDRYVDCCTMSATLGKDGKVRITHVTWDIQK